MRPLLRILILTFALAFAGCTTPGDDVTPAATEEPDEEATTTPTPSTPVPSTPASAKPTTSPANQSAAPSAPTAPTPPPPPAKVPWNLTGQARVGWAAGVGTGGAAAPAQGQSDADHCPDATIAVPAGANVLRIVVTGEPVSPEGPGAGQLVLTLTGPDGTSISLEPGAPDPAAEEAAARELVATAPAAGVWTVHAEPLGPVVAQTWSLAIEVGGESEVAPAVLPVAGTC